MSRNTWKTEKQGRREGGEIREKTKKREGREGKSRDGEKIKMERDQSKDNGRNENRGIFI